MQYTISTALVSLAAMLWGSDLLLRHSVLNTGMSPVVLVLIENAILTLLLSWVFIRGWKIILSLSRREWVALIIVGCGGSAIATYLYTSSFTLGSPLTAVLLQKTQPVFALVLAGFVLGERRSRSFWLFSALALAGAFLLTGITGAPNIHDIRWQQSAYALSAAAIWGASTVAGKELGQKLSPALLAGARFALAVPILTIIALFTIGHSHNLSYHIAAPEIGNLILIILFPDLAGMWLYYVGLRGSTASTASIAELTYPLTALIIGLFFLHLRLSVGQWAGLFLLLGGVFALSLSPNEPVHKSAESIRDRPK